MTSLLNYALTFSLSLVQELRENQIGRILEATVQPIKHLPEVWQYMGTTHNHVYINHKSQFFCWSFINSRNQDHKSRSTTHSWFHNIYSNDDGSRILFWMTVFGSPGSRCHLSSSYSIQWILVFDLLVERYSGALRFSRKN